MRASGQSPGLSSERGACSCSGGAGLFPPCVAALLLFLLCAAPAFAGDMSAATNQSRGEWVSNLGWFIGGIAAAITAYDKLRRKPVLEVEFLRREEADKRLQRLSEKIDSLRNEMRADLKSVADEMKAQGEGFEAQLREIYERLGQLRGRIQT